MIIHVLYVSKEHELFPSLQFRFSPKNRYKILARGKKKISHSKSCKVHVYSPTSQQAHSVLSVTLDPTLNPSHPYSNVSSPKHSVLPHRHSILQSLDEPEPDLCNTVALERVLKERHIYVHLDLDYEEGNRIISSSFMLLYTVLSKHSNS